MLQSAIDACQMERIQAHLLEIRGGSSQQRPDLRVGAVALSVSRERCGSVARGIDGEGNQTELARVCEIRSEFPKLRTHARTRAITRGEDKVRNPDLPVELLPAVEGLTRLIRQGEIRNYTVAGQGRAGAAACEEQN
jgi:hypothetical protein